MRLTRNNASLTAVLRPWRTAPPTCNHQLMIHILSKRKLCLAGTAHYFGTFQQHYILAGLQSLEQQEPLTCS